MCLVCYACVCTGPMLLASCVSVAVSGPFVLACGVTCNMYGMWCHMSYDMRHVTCDTWHVSYVIWHGTCDMWYVTCVMWHVMCDMWHVIWGVTFHAYRVTCHMSHGTCHMSHVTCHMSHVTCHMHGRRQVTGDITARLTASCAPVPQTTCREYAHLHAFRKQKHHLVDRLHAVWLASVMKTAWRQATNDTAPRSFTCLIFLSLYFSRTICRHTRP
jgi:hypothetical protein